MNQPLSQPLEIFLMNDQPFTCPHCGAKNYPAGKPTNSHDSYFANFSQWQMCIAKE